MLLTQSDECDAGVKSLEAVDSGVGLKCMETILADINKVESSLTRIPYWSWKAAGLFIRLQLRRGQSRIRGTYLRLADTEF